MNTHTEEVFFYPQIQKGHTILTQETDTLNPMYMDIEIYQLETGQELDIQDTTKETALLLIQGQGVLHWNQQTASLQRPSFIDDPAYLLHVPHSTPIHFQATKFTEILVQKKTNPQNFPIHFYTPENTQTETFGQGQFEGKAQRTVRTFFDHSSAPYSNMVCGEIIAPQGGWSSYIPHDHFHPEVYYYRFPMPQGFGACFIQDQVFKIQDRSFAAIPGGKTHPQVTAPGYPLYYVWMIPHFPDNPWNSRNMDPNHTWLLEE